MQQATPEIELYLWLGLLAVVVLLLVLAFAYVLVQRRQQWLVARFEHDVLERLDAWLSGHTPRLWRWIKSRFSPAAWHGLLLTASVGFVLALLVVFSGIAASWLERAAFYEVDRFVNQAVLGPVSDELVGLLGYATWFGNNETAIGLIVLLAAWFMIRREWWHLLALAILEGLGAPMLLLLKAVFARTRPESPYMTAAGYSFPSGHAFTGMVLYGFLIYLTWRYTHRTVVRVPVTVALGLLIVMIALSRVVLSVHWVSDVTAGLTIGLAWLVTSLIATRAIRDTVEPGAPI